MSAIGPAAPAVSVVLPVHNALPYVEECVRSILAQTFRDFELVIGDDGSTDGTSALLESLAGEDSRIRLLRRERPSGLASAENWVVGASRAPLVALANADDRAYPERLGRQAALFAAAPDVDLVGTLWDGIDESGRRVRPGDYWRLLRASPFAPFSHSSIMMRRTAFERAGGYRAETNYWEDLDLYYRIARRGRIVVLPEVLSTVRHARASTRLRDPRERVERAVDLMFRCTLEYRRSGDHEPLVRAAAAGGAGGRLHPLTFVSCGSTNLWTGRRPAVLRRLLRRGRLGLDAGSLHALAWTLWGTLSPRSLRAALRALIGLRNLAARPIVRRRAFVDWSPGPRSGLRPAAEPVSGLSEAAAATKG